MLKPLAFASLVLVLAGSSAQARHYRHHHHPRHVLRHFVRHGTLPSDCHVAARMGGPCGCWAAHILLGTTKHVVRGVNLWLANDWLRVPRTRPEEALAAVWPHRHVAPVVPGTYKDDTIVVRDHWRTHRVRTAGLVFVRPDL
jgi:hypothetical protein